MKGAKNLSARFRRDHKERDRNHINIRRLPDSAFDAHTSLEFFDPVARADDYAVVGFPG